MHTYIYFPSKGRRVYTIHPILHSVFYYYSVLEVAPYSCLNLSNSCKIFYMDIPWYIYLNPLICYWWTFALFPSFCYYKQCCNRCPCTHDISHAWASIYTEWISKRTAILLLLCTYVVPTYTSMIRYNSTGLIAPS